MIISRIHIPRIQISLRSYFTTRYDELCPFARDNSASILLSVGESSYDIYWRSYEGRENTGDIELAGKKKKKRKRIGGAYAEEDTTKHESHIAAYSRIPNPTRADQE